MRTLCGHAVLWDTPGRMTVGGHPQLVTFRRGTLTWPEDVTRVKVLREHDQRGPVLGHLVEIEDTPTGLLVTAQLEADLDGRDALSPGVDFDLAAMLRLRTAAREGKPGRGSGHLVEVSLVAVAAWPNKVVTAA